MVVPLLKVMGGAALQKTAMVQLDIGRLSTNGGGC